MKSEQINLRISKEQKARIKYLSKKSKSKSLSSYIIDASLNLDNSNNYFRKINTLTINPSINFRIKIDRSLANKNYFEQEKTENFLLKGSGLNISKIVNDFHFPTMAIHYSGAIVGTNIKNILNDWGIFQVQLYSKIPTPISFTVNYNDQSYYFQNNSIALNDISKQQLLKIANTFSKGEIFVLNDDFHILDQKFIIELCEFLQDRGIHLAYKVSKHLVLPLLNFNPLIVTVKLSNLELKLKKKIFNKINNVNLNLLESEILSLKGKTKITFVCFEHNKIFIHDQNNEFYYYNFVDKNSNFFKENNIETNIDSFLGGYLANYFLGNKEAIEFGCATYFANFNQNNNLSLEKVLQMKKQLKPIKK